MDLATWNAVLDLSGVEVVAAERCADERAWQLTVISTTAVALCPRCTQPTGCQHLARWEVIEDLPACGHAIRLRVQVLQFLCAHCQTYCTVHPACVLEHTHVTVRLAEALTDCVNVSTLSAAAATYHVAERTVKDLYEQVVARRCQMKAPTLKPILKLGIDEIHLEVHGSSPAPPGATEGAPPVQPPAVEGGEKISRG